MWYVPAAMRSLPMAVALLLACASPGPGEELQGRLYLGEDLHLYLLPDPGLFTRLFSAVGISSPPEAVDLTATSALGRDELVFARAPGEDGEWDLYARVRSRRDEESWYRVARSTRRLWEIALVDRVKIARVKKGALDVFEGSVRDDPWFLKIEAPTAAEVPERPSRLPFRFWLDEFVFSYDDMAHSRGSRGAKAQDNYTTLKRALVTALPESLGDKAPPEHAERVKQLSEVVRKAGNEELVPLRDLLEAKVEALEAGDEGADPVLAVYRELLEHARRRTADE